LANDTRCTVVALQETKLAAIQSADVSEVLGARFSNQFAFLPAQEIRGGILFAVADDFYSITSVQLHAHSLTTQVEAKQCLSHWWITVVYGPQSVQDKVQFLAELRAIKQVVGNRWVLLGDFNLILDAADKSNDNLNRRLMSEFRNTINYLELKEICLTGRKFTWSNDTTQTRIDRAFCTVDWEMMLPNLVMHALSSSVSDHSPLFLMGASVLNTFKGFRFESFWPSIPRFQEVVQHAWDDQVNFFNPFLRLHIKFTRTAKALRKWAKKNYWQQQTASVCCQAIGCHSRCCARVQAAE